MADRWLGTDDQIVVWTRRSIAWRRIERPGTRRGPGLRGAASYLREIVDGHGQSSRAIDPILRTGLLQVGDDDLLIL